MSKTFFIIETHPNPEIITYHVRREILEKEKYKDGLFASKTLFPKTEEILQRIRDTRGIEAAYSRNKYSFSIEKGMAFKWSELKSEIEDIIMFLSPCLAHGKAKRHDAPCLCS